MKSLMNLVRRFTSSPRPSPRGPKASRPVLRAEALEDRFMLSTFEVVNTLSSGPGSLRQAIVNANANPGWDEITFNIPGSGVRRIQPTTAYPLPAITDPLLIDGHSQPDYAGSQLIELNGALAGTSVSGLRINVGLTPEQTTVVRGLVINGFASGAGVYISGSSDVRLVDNHLGTNAAGTAAIANRNGVTVACSEALPCSGIQIGSLQMMLRNVISGNSQDGILVTGAGPAYITIIGNNIGTTANGAAALGNVRNGVTLSGPLDGTYISGNVIAANRNHGIHLTKGTAARGPDWVTIAENFIGSNRGGGLPLGNQFDGVSVSGPSLGTMVYENTIRHSGRNGVRVDGNARLQIMANRMTRNVGEGILLLNGGNSLTPRPTIVSAHFDGSQTTVVGTVTTTPNTFVTVEVFGNAACHASGFGEGWNVVQQFEVRTDAGGWAQFTASFAGSESDPFVSATASPLVSFWDEGSQYEYFGDTSPFSSCVRPTGYDAGPGAGSSQGGSGADTIAALSITEEAAIAPLSAEHLPELAVAPESDVVSTLAASDESVVRRSAAVRRADLAFVGLEQPAEWLAL